MVSRKTPKPSVHANRYSKHIKDVDRWFRDYKKLVLDRISEYEESVKTKIKRRLPRVKVAVVDSCIDSTQALMPELQDVKRYCACPPDEEQPCHSTHIPEDELTPEQFEHGTHVTALLYHLAPFARIYVAELGPANEELRDKPLAAVSQSKFEQSGVHLLMPSPTGTRICY